MYTSEIPKGDVVLQLGISPLLKRLEAEESRKPASNRIEVPNIPTLASIAGVNRGTMYNFVNGKVKQVNLEILTAIFNELRRRGFEITISDLLIAHPVESM